MTSNFTPPSLDPSYLSFRSVKEIESSLPFSRNHITTESYSDGIPTHTVRIVLRTTDESGTNEYVDGTDIFVSIDEVNQIAVLTWEDLWIEGPPIFHGGTVTDALKWGRELSEPFYIQLQDPHPITEQRIALNGCGEDLDNHL